jgi:hypothetical protein
MTKFTDNLWSDIVKEHGPTLANADRPESGRSAGARLLRRPRVLAGSSLGMAGIAAGLVLALGGSTAAPAFAVTTQSNGSVLVQLSYVKNQDLPQVNAKLASMGTGEQITINMAPGAATVPGPVTCTAAAGTSGPTVKVLNGDNGTEVIKPGESGDNTAEGTFHLVQCTTSNIGSGNSGNTGAASAAHPPLMTATQISN